MEKVNRYLLAKGQKEIKEKGAKNKAQSKQQMTMYWEVWK